MSTTIETHPELVELSEAKSATAPKVIGIITILAGVIMSFLGAFTYNMVGNQLEAQNIVVAEDAAFLAGEPVRGPFSAFAEAQIINDHTLDSTEGRTYADMDREDPMRNMAMNSAFLQASLYTSVVAFGLAALVTGLGVLFILSGAAFVALAKVRK